ncbi:MAG: alpha-glucosidase/alpha-galactosidase [Spirochaetaceae bacterium]|nr:MAG: alpha-glucosidase/alpha-galactosidase [Spirochaetaceae bacterium]
MKAKITFIGAGSTVFAKNILGDILLTDGLHEVDIALYDIDAGRLDDSKRLVETLNSSINQGRARIQGFVGVEKRREALRDADFVINAIQIGGYEPATVRDFEIPKKYGLRQTIGDTLGIGGIFRTLRTAPVMWDIAEDMAAVCPKALLLNYTNPMCTVTGAVVRETGIQTVGLCHSVQGCAKSLLSAVDMTAENPRWHIAGINHMAWLLEFTDGDKDLYPEIKSRAKELLAEARAGRPGDHDNLVRLAVMETFGYYITESSEHNAEYTPWWIKSRYPELIENFNIPLDEYPRRCVDQIAKWNDMRESLLGDSSISHELTLEYASQIIEAVVKDKPTRIHGNILNQGHIANLPDRCVVEVPCLVDTNGVHGVVVGNLPEQCAALNRTNVNVHLVSLEAAKHQDRQMAYQAAALDPHTAAELSLEDIVKMCDELFEAHRDMLPDGYY